MAAKQESPRDSSSSQEEVHRKRIEEISRELMSTTEFKAGMALAAEDFREGRVVPSRSFLKKPQNST